MWSYCDVREDETRVKVKDGVVILHACAFHPLGLNW